MNSGYKQTIASVFLNQLVKTLKQQDRIFTRVDVAHIGQIESWSTFSERKSIQVYPVENNCTFYLTGGIGEILPKKVLHVWCHEDQSIHKLPVYLTRPGRKYFVSVQPTSHSRRFFQAPTGLHKDLIAPLEPHHIGPVQRFLNLGQIHLFGKMIHAYVVAAGQALFDVEDELRMGAAYEGHLAHLLAGLGWLAQIDTGVGVQGGLPLLTRRPRQVFFVFALLLAVGNSLLVAQKRLDGQIELVVAQQLVDQVEKRVLVTGIGLQCPLEAFDGPFQLSQLGIGQAGVVQRVGVARILFQNGLERLQGLWIGTLQKQVFSFQESGFQIFAHRSICNDEPCVHGGFVSNALPPSPFISSATLG